MKTKHPGRLQAIVDAQRRVLEMVAYQIEKMPARQRRTLRVDRETGLTTWDDILTHVNAARSYPLKEPRPR
jgi:hypothetical protein